MPTTIIVFTRAAIPGKAKTRLIPKLGKRGAARVQYQLANKRICNLTKDTGCNLIVATAGPQRHASLLQLRRNETSLLPQQGRDLGKRMFNASRRLAKNSHAIILLGTDCPALTPQIIKAATRSLKHNDAVAIPATDGGYVLLGFKKPEPLLFQLSAWGHADVMQQTRRQLRRLQWQHTELPSLSDLDTPQDWLQARRAGLLPPLWKLNVR